MDQKLSVLSAIVQYKNILNNLSYEDELEFRKNITKDIRLNLIEVKNILQKILSPSKNQLYISSNEIYQNDILTHEALNLIKQTLGFLDLKNQSNL